MIAKQGDIVRVHYTGKLDDGTVFDTSTERDPLEFQIGSGTVISGFEQAVIGMSPGESKTEVIATENAYGYYLDEMVFNIEHQQLPEVTKPEVGLQLQLQHPDGKIIPVIITDISSDTITLDANHPLAGEDLTFDIQLVEIV
jgi:peptidylprolyl isomerase